jgi:dephospho-CoA kinase
MVEETRRRITAFKNEHVVLNAAILHRMNLHLQCDLVLLVVAPAIIRFIRGRRRDHLGAIRIAQRMRSQKRDDTPKQFLNERRALVDTVKVRNGGSKSALSRRLTTILSDYGITGR